jgi:hypothetical protein
MRTAERPFNAAPADKNEHIHPSVHEWLFFLRLCVIILIEENGKNEKR